MNWYAVTGRIVDGDDDEIVVQADCNDHAIEQFKDYLRNGEDIPDDEIIISAVSASRTQIFWYEVPELRGEDDQWLPTTPTHTAADTPDPTTAASHFIT